MHLTTFKPVADFFCNKYYEEFELKSKLKFLSKLIVDGSYYSMISRINSKNNPNFFLLVYNENWSVKDFLVIPIHFFTNDLVIKRSPLVSPARRVGWIGCNINISAIPDFGKIFLVKNSQEIDRELVKVSFNSTLFIRNKNADSKGWLLDIIKCIEEIYSKEFTIDQVYNFEQRLKLKHHNNYFIKDKIRQQLQILRDRGFIEFVSRGKYRKIKI